MNEIILKHKEYSNQNGLSHKTNRLITFGVSFLCWYSPIVGLGIFFPIGALLLFPKNLIIRLSAFNSLVFQFIIYLIFYPLELYTLIGENTENAVKNFIAKIILLLQFTDIQTIVELFDEISRFVNGLMNDLNIYYFNSDAFFIKQFSFYLIFLYSAIAIVLLIANRLYWQKKAQNSVLYLKYGIDKKQEFISIPYILFTIIGTIVLTLIFLVLDDKIFQFRNIAYTLREFTILYWFSFLAVSSLLNNKRVFSIFRRLYCSMDVHFRLSLSPKSPRDINYKKKYNFTRIREWILPGWGHIYLQRYWKGFPLLFIFLILLLFFTISLYFYFELASGIRFMGSLGLKPGIPDKQFLKYADNPIFIIMFGICILCIYAFSNWEIVKSLKEDYEPIQKRGLQSGFFNNIPLSLLVHLILICIIFIIPIMLSRASSKNKKQDLSKKHFQPKKMEFYFIDPEIPDEIKDLNGGVISGTETPNQKEGIKIPDEKPSDEGKVKGYVKRIRGKKLPKTYSNYISARMRGPETFMEYWRRAPYPYSCVVAYTITRDGDITDVQMVETSDYPEQDLMTIELIESLSPVMPPPNVNGEVRVTELFWNGPIDPDAMPTPLQKEMVLMFDGRYMEEF